MRVSLTCLSFCALFCSAALQAQERFVPHRLTVNNGLSENNVWSMTQDSDGFFWFNTQAGLTKYDGYSFSPIPSRSADAGSPTNDIIGPILESRNTRFLWIGSTTNGLHRLDRMTGKIEAMPSLPHDSLSLDRPGNRNVVAVYEDKKGIVWIGTDQALNSLDPLTGRVTRFLLPADTGALKQALAYYSIVECNDSTLWLGTHLGLCLFNTRSGEFRRVPVQGQYFPVYTVRPRSDQELWIGTHGRGALQIDSRGNILTHLLDTENVCSMYDDGFALWFGAVSGKLLKYDVRTKIGTLIRYTEPGEATRQISSLLKDQTGLMWAATLGGGVYALTPQSIEFHLYRHEQHHADVPSSYKAVWSVAELNDRTIVVGTGRGLAKLDRNNGVYRDVPHASFGFQVRAILEDSQAIYAGLLTGGLVRRDRAANVWRRCINPDTVLEENVYSLLQDHQGQLWLGTNGGPGMLTHYNHATGKFTAFWKNHWDRWALALYEDRKQRMWVGTWASGIARFDRSNGTFDCFSTDGAPDTITSSDCVTVIHESDRMNDVLWLGTLGAGLLRFDVAAKTFETFNEQAGLAGNSIYGMLEDDFGNLWMSTNHGLSRFDPRTRAFKNFDVHAGLQGNEFNLGASCKGRDGMLYFGGDNGLNAFKPEDDVNPHPPRVLLTGFKTFGAARTFGLPLSELRQLTLPYTNNQISIEFVGLHFKDPAQNKYAYMLEGYDNEWKMIGTKREANFAHLEPGAYIFKVKAANSDGVWSEPVSVSIIVPLPLWKAPWFYVVMGILVAGMAVGAYRFNVRKAVRIALEHEHIRKEVEIQAQQRLQKKVHDQLAGHAANATRRLQDLSDDLNNGRTETAPALHDINESLDMLINELRNLNWQVDPTKDSLFDLLAQLRQYGENLFRKTHIRFSLAGVQEEFMNTKLPPEWREELLLLFEEAMNNVVKHGINCTETTLTVAHLNGMLELCLSNNGQGFDERECAEKRGLHHIRERAAALNGEVRILSATDSGTSVGFKGKLPSGRG